MKKSYKALYVAGAVILLAITWLTISSHQFPEGVWDTGIRIRLMGFIVLACVLCYFALTRISRK